MSIVVPCGDIIILDCHFKSLESAFMMMLIEINYQKELNFFGKLGSVDTNQWALLMGIYTLSINT